MRKILSVLLALSMLVACVGMLSVSAENPSYLEMTNDAGGDPGNAIVVGAGNYYAVHFNVTTAFTGIRMAQWTPGSGAGSADWTLAVYNWDKDFATSRAGTPVAQTSGTSTGDNLTYDLTFDKAVPAGNYVLVFSVTALNAAANPGMHVRTGTAAPGVENCFEWETDATKNNFGDRPAAFKLIAGSDKDVSAFIALDAENPGETEQQFTTKTISELFWIAKLTVGTGGEVKDSEGIDFGTPDAPALQVDLTPGEYVTHVSYDEVKPGVVCNQTANGDKLITLPTVAEPQADGTVVFWGWLGTKAEIVNFSYSVDGGEKVDVGKYPTEEGVINAAMGVAGTKDASRYEVKVPVEANGTYVIRVYVNMQVKVPVESEPTEPVKPYVEWTEYGNGKGLSWDTIFVNDGNTRVDGIADGGPALMAWLAEHDNTVSDPDFAISTLYPKGWIGLDQQITAMGYCLDDSVLVYPEGAMSEAEAAVKNAGGEFAVRFKIPIDVSDLYGKHSIVVVAKLADGTVVAATNPGQPVKFNFARPEYIDWADSEETVESSWDSIFINKENQTPDGFTDGHVNDYMDEHEGMIDGSDGSIETVFVRGWIGFKHDVVAMGYTIDGERTVFVDNTLVEAEAGVKGAGGEHATRFTLPIDVTGLTGKHEIVVVAKLANGMVIAATKPAQKMTFTYEGPEPADTPSDPTDTPSDPTDTPSDPTDTPSDPTDTPSDPTDTPSDPTDTPSDPTDTPSDPTDKPDNPGTGDNTVAMFVLVLMGAAMAFSVAVVLKKRSYNK